MSATNARSNIEVPKAPVALHPTITAIVVTTDAFCERHLDCECGQLCRRLVGRLAWLIEVDGLPVDARWLPEELQAEARRRGLIPNLDHPRAA